MYDDLEVIKIIQNIYLEVQQWEVYAVPRTWDNLGIIYIVRNMEMALITSGNHFLNSI